MIDLYGFLLLIDAISFHLGYFLPLSSYFLPIDWLDELKVSLWGPRLQHARYWTDSVGNPANQNLNSSTFKWFLNVFQGLHHCLVVSKVYMNTASQLNMGYAKIMSVIYFTCEWFKSCV